MNHTTLRIVAIIAVAALAAGLVAISTQAAHAQGTSTTDFPLTQTQSNDCSGVGTTCSNEATESVGR
jgi:uncharacterized membrane protein